MVQKKLENTKPNKKKKRTGSKVFKYILISLFAFILLTIIAGAGIVLAMIKTAPPLDVNQILNLDQPSVLYDDKGIFMDNTPTDQKRTIVKYNSLPQNLINAFVSIEDERFYQHKGVDYQRVVGSVLIDIENKIKKNDNLQGGSTITQQLIKNTIGGKDMTITRKVQEMYLATELEKHLSKQQVLEAYLNTIPLGGQAYGVEAAANQYFNKSVKDLNLIQCAYIAGVTQSPSLYNAYSLKSKKDPSIYLNRTETVLYKMYTNPNKANSITKAQYDQALSDLKNKKLVFTPTQSTNTLNYEWFDRPVLEEVKTDLKAKYNYSDSEINNLIMYGGLKIYTTMNKSLQDASQAIIDNDNTYGVTSPLVNGIKKLQAAAVVMDYHSGEVKVIIGGRGIQPPLSFNRAAYNGAKTFVKPTGSCIKPLTVYSPAIDLKLATAGTVIEDSPLPVELGKLNADKNGTPYNPQNYDTEGFSGYSTIRNAITRSINLVAIKLEYQIGLKTGADYAAKYGIKLDEADKSSVAALALGQLTHGTNPMTMAAAFGTFGNNGLYTDAKMYTKVVDKNGATILDKTPVTTKKILSPQGAYIMYDLLKGPVNGDGGTAGSANLGSMPAAGKTGTSGSKEDFWFSGLTPYYSGSVWIGSDTPTSYTSVSSYTAAGVWGKIMKIAHQDLAVKDIDKPSGIVTSPVCKDSGKIPTDLCNSDPRGGRSYNELFIDGTEPTALCDIHVSGKINITNNKLATDNTPANLIANRVFIKRSYVPSVQLGDQIYVLPTQLDDTPATTTVIPITPINNGG